jgi:alkylhydroperoxidase/carboxymuconolactone decarboxylase family protein YurZ
MAENPLSTMQNLDPELVRRMRESEEFAYADGALPRKFKLLIAMAFDASHGAIGGVRSLASQALKAGATKEEIAEALRVAYLLGGIGSVYIGSQGLKDVFPE